MSGTSPDSFSSTIRTKLGGVGGSFDVTRSTNPDSDASHADNQLATSLKGRRQRLLGRRTQHIAGVSVLFRVPMHLIVRKDANIAGIEDLRGKRISVGVEARRERFTAERLLENSSCPAPRSRPNTSKSSRRSPNFRRGASMRTSPTVACRIPRLRRSWQLAAFVCCRWNPERIAGLRMSEPFVLPFTFPKGIYPQQEASVTTVAIPIVLLASTATADDVVEGELDAIGRQVSDLVARHPTAAEIDLRQPPSLRDGMRLERSSAAFGDLARRLHEARVCRRL